MANDDDEYLDPDYIVDPDEEQGDRLPLQEEVPKPTPRRKAKPEEVKAARLPIAEAETAETLHGEVRMTRSLSLGGSKNDQVHFSVMLPVILQPEWTLPQQGVAAADTSGLVKSIVYSQLGLAFTVDENGIMQEVLSKFPGVERVREHERERDDEPEQRSERREHNGHGQFPHPRHLERPGHVDPEVWLDLVENFGDWFDNRKDKASGKYKSTAPDFKRAEDSETIWLKPYRRPAPTSSRRGYDER